MKSLFKIVLLTLLTLFTVQITQAQVKRSVRKLCDKAVEQIEKREFEKAIQTLNKAIKKDSTFPELYIRLGDVYNFTLESEKSALAYHKAIALLEKPDPILYMFAADEELKSGQYKEALRDYQIFMQQSKNKTLLEEVEKKVKQCEFGVQAVKNPVNLTPVNMGGGVNSEWDEYLATLTADEQELIFTVKRPRDEKTICTFCITEEDFYFSLFEDSVWKPRKPLGPPVNSSYNEGAQTISPDGKYLFFTLCNAESGYGSCDLYWSKRVGGKWSRPRNFGAPVNTPAWESQPSIAPDGKTIYFVSNREGSIGGTDIWKTEMLEEGLFSIPVNLGPVINTESEETAPFIHPDGTTLYFVSDGHIGMGGRDLFFSTLLADGSWSTPLNMGYPINTHADELSIFINASGTRAYYASDKEGGFGGMDIYYFELDHHLRPTPVTYMKGQIKDADTREPIEADIEMIDLDQNKVITSTRSDPFTGEFLACIRTGTNVMLNIMHPYYLFYSENFYLKKMASELEPILKDIYLQKPEKGNSLVLDNIFFEFDQSTLKPESFVELDYLVSFLQKNSKIRIEISGHTDNQGDDEYNMKLSVDRAKSVFDYIVSKGIDPSRVEYRGYGESKPIASNETEEGRALNRRTEMMIIDNK